jgi:hypothetical protein
MTTTTTTSTTTAPFDADAVRFQLSQLDAILERVLDANELKIADLRRCEWIDYCYPHPGCAEFGPPDEISCSDRATRRVVFADPFVHPDDVAEAESWVDPHVSTLLCCAEHAERFASDPETIRVELLVGDGSELQGVAS